VLIPHFVQLEVDAGDSPANRLSAFNFCNPFDHTLPFTDGVISALDRQHLWGMYAGIAADPPPAVSPVKKLRGFTQNVGKMMK